MSTDGFYLLGHQNNRFLIRILCGQSLAEEVLREKPATSVPRLATLTVDQMARAFFLAADKPMPEIDDRYCAGAGRRIGVTRFRWIVRRAIRASMISKKAWTKAAFRQPLPEPRPGMLWPLTPMQTTSQRGVASIGKSRGEAFPPSPGLIRSANCLTISASLLMHQSAAKAILLMAPRPKAAILPSHYRHMFPHPYSAQGRTAGLCTNMLGRHADSVNGLSYFFGISSPAWLIFVTSPVSKISHTRAAQSHGNSRSCGHKAIDSLDNQGRAAR
jgi:hypothetical protein